MQFVTTLAAAAFALAASTATASTISTLSQWDNATSIDAWGGGATNTYGEVLVAPGSSLSSFTFGVDNQGLASNYVAEVYAWSGSTTAGGQVGNALYSGPASVLAGFDGFQAVTVDTGGVAVTPGQQYAILLYDNSADGVRGRWGLTPPFGVHPGVAGDVGFFFNNGPSNANGTFNDFGSLAYSATFAGGVPEPMTWTLMLVGFGGTGMAVRSARRRTAVAA